MTDDFKLHCSDIEHSVLVDSLNKYLMKYAGSTAPMDQYYVEIVEGLLDKIDDEYIDTNGCTFKYN